MTIGKRRYGFNIFTRPVEDVLDYTFQNKLDYIELHLTDKHSPIESFTTARIKKIVEFTQKNKIGLGLHLPNRINISDLILPLRKSNIKYLKECIRLAGNLKASTITMHIGSFYWFPVEHWMRRKALDRFVISIEQTLDYCIEYNVCLALENVVPIPQGSDYHYLGDNPGDFEYIFSKLPSENIKLCLDTGHANISNSIQKYFDNFSEKIIAVHFHDNLGNDDQHLPVGDGNIDWAKFASEILKIKFNGPLISECKNLKPHESARLLEDIFESEEKKVKEPHQ